MALFNMSIILQSTQCLLLIYFLILPIFTFCCNYLSARKTGLRIIYSPITPYTLTWQLASYLLRPTLSQFRWYRAIDWTCAFQDYDILHKELGWNFIVVSPGLNVVCSSDPQTIKAALDNWRGFVKPDNVNGLLGTFGPNVDTSNGDAWPRHRKITAPCLSERASSTVWTHAIRESDSILSVWLTSPSPSTSSQQGQNTSLIRDTSTLALNVISAVAFENHAVNTAMPGHAMSLREALVTVMSTGISPAIEWLVPYLIKSGLTNLLPTSAQKLLYAMSEFRWYMDETIIREREKTSKTAEARIDGGRGHLSLIQTLLQANDASMGVDGGKKGRLSDEELRGNIFIFTIGGLESTSATLGYTIALLAVHTDVQAWVYEEIQEVMRTENMEYADCFPKLKRVMAVMYETLRLYNPSPPLPRSSSTPQLSCTLPTTQISPFPSSPKNSTSPTQSTLSLPGNTQLMLNSWALHTSSTHYSSPKTWNPKRWISTNINTSLNSPNSPHTPFPTLSRNYPAHENETLHHPSPLSSTSPFFAWGTGPRICPGQKFSQVEFTAVLANVLRHVEVKVFVKKEDDDEGRGGGMEEQEEEEEARKKVLAVLRDSVADPLLLHVREPEKLCLRMVERV